MKIRHELCYVVQQFYSEKQTNKRKGKNDVNPRSIENNLTPNMLNYGVSSS